MAQRPVAIIDIGSNSVRLVVYAGATRAPWTIFNEKVMAALGETLTTTGALSKKGQERALGALRRFRQLTREMGVARTRVVATAAVRDASNGAEFLRQVRAIGFEPEVLSGETEGMMAGLGVLSAIPQADGIVADLGGGSLELVDVADGKVDRSASLPFGVLRLGPLLDKGEAALARKLAKAIEAAGFADRGRKRVLYLVGGSWRALASIDMVLSDFPLPIIHEYCMMTDRPAELQPLLKTLKLDRMEIPSLSRSRIPSLPLANLLLKNLTDVLRPSVLVVSSFGIREGLLFNDLSREVRALDPLLEATHEAGRGLGRFDEHGALLDRWIATIFDDEPWAARLRLAACMLADVAWQAHPDFRAERGVDMALHGNWVGIDAPGRVMIAQALFCNFGGGGSFAERYEVAVLCTPDELAQASRWGLAMRLAQRLSGGVAASLQRSRLSLQKDVLRLTVQRGEQSLLGETIERRLKTLANAVGVRPDVAVV